MSKHATLQMNDTPDSPETASTVMVPLWARDLVGYRIVRMIHWLAARTGAVAYTTVAY